MEITKYTVVEMRSMVAINALIGLEHRIKKSLGKDYIISRECTCYIVWDPFGQISGLFIPDYSLCRDRFSSSNCVGSYFQIHILAGNKKDSQHGQLNA